MSALSAIRSVVDYDSEVRKISQFMEKFVATGGKKQVMVGADSGSEEAMDMDATEFSPAEPSHIYMDMLQKVANRTQDTVEIKLDDVRDFEVQASSSHPPFTFAGSLAFRIENNTKCYVEMFSRAIDQMMPEPDSSAMQDPEADVMDVIYQARRDRDRRDREAMQAVEAADPMQAPPAQDPAAAESFPAVLTRRYTVRFIPRASQHAQA
ncbi:DNA replication licensing factor MCM7, partial [Coemansia sp. RSA 486]